MTPSGSDSRMQTGQWCRKRKSCRIICFAAEKGLLKIFYHCNGDFFYVFLRKNHRHCSFASTNHFSSSLYRKLSCPPIVTVQRIPQPPTFVEAARHLCFNRSISYTRPSIHRIRRGRIFPSVSTSNSQVHILFYISVPTYSTLLLCKPANVLTSFCKELTRFYRCCINQSFLSA